MTGLSSIGLDVGGTFTKAALVAGSGRVLREARLPTRPEEGPAAFVGRVMELLSGWKASGARPAALGLGIAGDVDSEKGLLRFSPNLRGWEGYPFKEKLARQLALPCVLENDANAAVYGAYVVELHRRPRHVVGVTLGTGVGGGLILNGRLYVGATGSAGEVGHTRVAFPGEKCHCGARGCLEAYAGSYGLARSARRLLAARPQEGAILRRLCPDLGSLEPRHLSEAARRGDRLAREVWRGAGEKLAIGLANLVLVLNPDAILLLGGVSRAGRWLLEPVRDALAHQSFRTPFDRAVVRLARPDGGRVGAALLALELASRQGGR